MTTDTIDDLLARDIDDLTSMAAALQAGERDALLISAAEALQTGARSELKLLRFIQALAAAPEPTLSRHAVETGAHVLITMAYADDVTLRLTSLRALAILTSRARELSQRVTHAMLGTFERARVNPSSDVRNFVNDVLLTDHPVFRQLISLEVPSLATRR